MEGAVITPRRDGGRVGVGLQWAALGFLLLFAAFELAHPVADLIHTRHHLSHGTHQGSAHNTPAGEDPVQDAHGPFLLVAALLPSPPRSRCWEVILADRRPESSPLSVPSPVPIG